MDGYIFDIHSLWKDILKRSKESDDPDFADFPDYLEKNYPGAPELEELTCYKAYLSQFVLNEELCGKEFLNDCDMSRDECILLLKLVAASFSSTYEVAYLKDADMLELTIHVTSGDQSVTKKLQEIWSFQVYTLYQIYLEEQLHLEFLFATGERDVEGQRKQRLSFFEEEMARCANDLHGSSGGHGGGRSVDDELDELLRS